MCRHIKNFTTFSKSATAIKEHAAQKDFIALSNSRLYDVWVYFDRKKQLVTLCSYILEHSDLRFPLRRNCKCCSWVCSLRHWKAKTQTRKKIKTCIEAAHICFGCVVTFKRPHFSAFVIATNRFKTLSWKVKTVSCNSILLKVCSCHNTQYYSVSVFSLSGWFILHHYTSKIFPVSPCSVSLFPLSTLTFWKQYWA